MKALNFAKRNAKEIIRDPLSIIFAILLPLFLLFIFQQFEIPNEVYNIENFTPGIIVFGFSFITLFTATLVAKDRSTSLIARLCASPMKIKDYILGYVLSVVPIVVLQNILFFIAAILLGLKLNINILLAIIAAIPISVLFIILGIFIGCFTTEKSASGISSVVVQLVAFTSGMYFSSDMMGKGFDIACKALPFSHCLNLIKSALNNSSSELWISCVIVIAYILAAGILTGILFGKKLKSDSK